jgi:hypothetical protein
VLNPCNDNKVCEAGETPSNCPGDCPDWYLSAAAVPSSLSVGATTGITAHVMNNLATRDGIIQVMIDGPGAANKVLENCGNTGGVLMEGSGHVTDCSTSWQAVAAGTYRIKVGVFTRAWERLAWKEDAGSFTVTNVAIDAGPPPDASVPDASEQDASAPDASLTDASIADASEQDASQRDASESDAMQSDAEQPDTSLADASLADASQPDTSDLQDAGVDGSQTPDDASSGNDAAPGGDGSQEPGPGHGCGCSSSSSFGGLGLSPALLVIWSVRLRRRARRSSVPQGE